MLIIIDDAKELWLFVYVFLFDLLKYNSKEKHVIHGSQTREGVCSTHLLPLLILRSISHVYPWYQFIVIVLIFHNSTDRKIKINASKIVSTFIFQSFKIIFPFHIYKYYVILYMSTYLYILFLVYLTFSYLFSIFIKPQLFSITWQPHTLKAQRGRQHTGVGALALFHGRLRNLLLLLFFLCRSDSFIHLYKPHLYSSRNVP